MQSYTNLVVDPTYSKDLLVHWHFIAASPGYSADTLAELHALDY